MRETDLIYTIAAQAVRLEQCAARIATLQEELREARDQIAADNANGAVTNAGDTRASDS